MDETMNKLKNAIKKVVKIIAYKLTAILLPIVIIIVLLSSFVYYITIDDGTYAEEDWKSASFASGQYTGNATVNADGTISSSMSAKDLWDKMMESESRVDLYLDGPEELLKLMNAETITKFPDTRDKDQINQPIDWEKINNIEQSTMQGIIKFKRKDPEGNESVMIYAEPYKFDSWIEDYNSTGDEETKKKLLSHFTIRHNNTSDTTNIVVTGKIADVTDVIVKEISRKDNYGLSKSQCQSWVGRAYEKAGFGYTASGCCAYLAGKKWGVSSDFSQIVSGAAVWTGEGSYRYTQCSTHTNGGCGHAGIYYEDNGEGYVMHLINGTVRKDTLTDWISTYGQGNTPVWGWQGGLKVVEEEGDSSEGEEPTTTTNQETETTVQTTSNNSFYVDVATWTEATDTITSDDPAQDTTSNHTYNMTTTKINYQDMVTDYTMPFHYLWALLVITEDKDFVMDLADLVYDSEIEITVHDNLTVNTNVNKYTYTKNKKTETEAKVTATGTKNDKTVTKSKNGNWTDEKGTKYTTTHTLTTKNNTLNIAVTLADVWMAKYSQQYTNEIPQDVVSNSSATMEDIPYPETPDEGGSNDTYGHANNLLDIAKDELESDDYINVSGHINYVNEDIYYSTVNRKEKITNTVKSNKYVSSPSTVEEKTDKESEEPNFVTILLDPDNSEAKSIILDIPDWLFEILETHEDTTDKIDLTKYLLYKATGTDYGIKEYDFSRLNPKSFNSITTGSGAEGGLSLTTTMFTKEVFKQALQAYYDKTGNQAFYKNFLLKADELYDASISNNVNPELVVITARGEGNFKESGGRYNYWGNGVPNGASSGYTYSSLSEGVAGYANTLNKYVTGNYAAKITQRYEERKNAGCDPLGYGLPGTLSGMQSIYSYLGKHEYGSAGSGGYYYMDPDRAGVTKIYSTHQEFLDKCKDSGLPEHAAGTATTVWEQGQYTAWQVENKLKYWDEIFGDFGSRSGIGGNSKIVELANSKLGCPYVWGAKGPNSFDCSGLVYWCYKQIGIDVPSTTDLYRPYQGSENEISWSEAQPGDILLVFKEERGKSSGHAGIYLGNDSYIHAPEPGKVVEIVESGASTKFKHVFRFN